MSKEKKEQEDQVIDNGAKASSMPKEIEKINAIRDIIFGHDMAEYDEQFNAVKNEITGNKVQIDENQKEILNKIEALQKHFDESLKSLEERINEKLATLQNEKTDRQMLGSLLEEIGKKIKE